MTERDAKGKFTVGHKILNPRDEYTGKFKPKSTVQEIQLKLTEEKPIMKIVVEPTVKTVKTPPEKKSEGAIIKHPHRTFRRWDELQEK
jgi:hypothetical protein